MRSKNNNKQNKMLVSNIDPLFQILSKANPHPKTELTFINSFTFSCGCIIGTGNGHSVNKATKTLFKKLPRPKTWLN